MNAMTSWLQLSQAYTQMSMAAGEIIMRRSMMLASGSMTQPQALAMMMEKGTALAASAEKATIAAASGADPTAIAMAALRPYGAKTRANVRMLRG